MKNELLLILDAIALLIKEQALVLETSSLQLVRKLIGTIEERTTKWNNSTGDDTTTQLMHYLNTVVEKIEDGVRVDNDKVARDVVVIINNGIETGDVVEDDILYDVIRNTFRLNGSKEREMKIVEELRRSIFSKYQEMKITDFFKSGSRAVTRGSISNLSEFILKKKEEFSELEADNSVADEAVLKTLDLATATEDSVRENFKEALEGRRVFKTGWHGLNKMLQGGVRAGELIVPSAMSGNYKTGLTLSLFTSVPYYNKPRECPPDKKPLAIWYSFEDDISMVIQNAYQILYYTKYKELVEIHKVPLPKVVTFIKEELERNGWNIKLIRVDPSKWTYRDLENSILNFEANGFDVQLCVTDYLDKLPTIGCDRSGPTGSDKKDLIKKVRNFMAARDITYITPWQLGSKAKEIKNSGIHPTKFAGEVAGASYYQGNSTLDTEIDCELIANVCKIKDGYWLNVVLGKHKLPTRIPDSIRGIFLPFPPVGYIPFDLDGDPIHKYTVAEIENNNTSSELF